MLPNTKTTRSRAETRAPHERHRDGSSASELALGLMAGRARGLIERGPFPWIAVAVAALVVLLLRKQVSWLDTFPAEATIPVADWINAFMDWFIETFNVVFHAISWLLAWPMDGLSGLLHWMPWPATMAVFVATAYAARGWKLALFTALALFYMLIIGYWDESMATLALVSVSVPLAIGIGITMGVLGFRYKWARRIIDPTLDLMQTIPTFAYLIPILLLFGFGPVVGLIASAVYASPPLVRNVMLGLSRVPSDVVESARMSGSTDRQLLWWVQFPSAMPTIMIGVNQAIMAALSMVIIAAVIGGAADIGWEVLSTMRRAQFGQSLMAGFVIALMAMVMDRTSRGFAERQHDPHAASGSLWQRYRTLGISVAVVAGAIALGQFVAPLNIWPKTLVFFPADPINNALDSLIASYGFVFDTIKKWALFYFLLPIRVGFEGVVRPFSFGFELTLPISLGYAGFIAALAVAATRYFSWRAAVGVVIIATMLYFGMTGTPWSVFMMVVVTLAWQVGGWKVGVGALVAMAFMLLTGVWEHTMLAVYLCGASVLVSFVLGSAIGIWASRNDKVSAFIRPINDTLQSMPLFVFLIPVLMFFRVGEFTAFLAIIAYAIVPAIRYTEHGLRNVRPDIVEAAKALGCTEGQLLRQVKLPLALPEIMLGLNQVVMFGLAMLVIAALVGTKGLGYLIYFALSRANVGDGVIAGLSMALIAIIADRIIQSWSNKKKAELGLSEATA